MEEDMSPILEACHSPLVGAHHGGVHTVSKVLQSIFYYPTLYREAHELSWSCEQCQKEREISRRHEMPLKLRMDMWGLDFMGSFLSSYQNYYILVADDCFSKWVEAISLQNNEVKIVTSSLKRQIFTKYGIPSAIISNAGLIFVINPLDCFLLNMECSTRWISRIF